MPPCNCTTHSCNGATRNRTTVATHREDDRRARARRALAAYDEVVQQEDEKLAAYISSVVLSDTAAPPAETYPWTPFTDNIHERICLQKTQTPITDTLNELAAIKLELEKLEREVGLLSKELSKPSSSSADFPLTPSHDAAKALQRRLANLTVHTKTLRSQKEAVVAHLSALMKSLATAKTKWCSTQECTKKDENKYGKYSSGMNRLFVSSFSEKGFLYSSPFYTSSQRC